MKNFEILAPVGGKEQLRAAVRCGANAVYLGAGDFNARRNAENFDFIALKEAVSYCHLRNVKVFVALNTLIFDKELPHLYKAIKVIAKSGADAVIVQDFATIKAVKEICPEMPLHASTQMAVHNISGALFLEKLGFSRIVLARELSLEEIKEIRKNVKAELEVFVHGAHCMSASGNCYLSAMLGERSGNRGLCAQGCRLNWKNRHKREYALSLKDMSYLDSIKSLCEIGVDSFKIEGRMKRPEYVAASVSSLKSALNGNNYDKETLRSVFSRSGFTDGYLKANRDTAMFGYRSKEDVTAAPAVLKDLAELYKNDIRPQKISATFTLKKDKPCVLTFNCRGETVSVLGEIPQEPRTAPLSEEIAFRNLSKLGDTPFTLEMLNFNNDDFLTLPASAINAVRRNAADELCEKICNKKRTINNIEPEFKNVIYSHKTPLTRVRLQSISQYTPLFEECDLVIIPINEILKNKDYVCNLPVKIVAELPELIYPEKESLIKEKLKEIKAMGISHGYTGNIGGIELLKNAGFKIHGSHALNITNSHSAEFYNEFCEDITLSFELTGKATEGFCTDAKKGVYVYGYLPLMLMRVCPQKSEKGCGDCNGKSVLTDRLGIEFPLLCRNKEFTVLHNSVPLYLGDKKLNHIDFCTLYFTTETKENCESIFNSYKKGKTISGKKTNGLWNRDLL